VWRKSLSVVALFLITSIQARAENWVTVSHITYQGREHFELVDSDSIIREGNVITYWQMDKGGINDDMANSKLATGETVGYIQIQKRLDCGGMWEIETGLRRRVDPTTGKRLHEWRMSEEYLEKSKKYYLPGTVGISKAQTICGLDTPKPTPPKPKQEQPLQRI